MRVHVALPAQKLLTAMALRLMSVLGTAPFTDKKATSTKGLHAPFLQVVLQRHLIICSGFLDFHLQKGTLVHRIHSELIAIIHYTPHQEYEFAGCSLGAQKRGHVCLEYRYEQIKWLHFLRAI